MTNQVKPIFQWQHANRTVLPYSWWQDCTEADFNARGNKSQFNSRILYPAAAYEALQKENAELKELLGKSLESLKNDCKAFADCRPRPHSMSQAEQEAWFSCWNSIYDDINNLDLSKYAETKKAVL